MLNKRPIFLVGFARGGTNILLNLLRSHPEVCSPRGETQEVFRGKASEPFFVRNAKRARYLPILLMERQDVFHHRNWQHRPEFSPLTRWLTDRILYADKMKALAPDQNYYKSEGVPYTREEIRKARLLCKNINGLIFLSGQLAKIYPDATFLTIVRDGFAVCEGHIRRGMDAAFIARNYERACQQIILDSAMIPGYHIITYEEIMARPQATLRKVYDLAGLDESLVTKIRLQHKPVMQASGEHQSTGGERPSIDGERPPSPQDALPPHKQLHWYDREEFGRFFRTDINENQKKRLSPEHRALIETECRSSLRHFGYL
jgi:hypothetical protein